MTRPSHARTRPSIALLALTFAVLTACTQNPASAPTALAPDPPAATLDGTPVVEDHDEHFHAPDFDLGSQLAPGRVTAQAVLPLVSCPPIGPRTSQVKGTQRVLLLPNDFPDRPLAEDVVINPNDLTKVRNFVRLQTLCQADLEFIIPPKRLHLQKPSKEYSAGEQMGEAIQLAKQQGFTERYDRYWLLSPRIGSTGLASLGGPHIWVGSFNGYANHEIAHTFSLHHPRGYDVSTFTSPAKIQLGYLTPAAPSATGGYTYVRARASGTFTLYAENVLGPGPGGHRALVVPDPTIAPIGRTLSYDSTQPNLVGPNDHVLSVRSEGSNQPRLYLHENGLAQGDGQCQIYNKTNWYCSPKPVTRLDLHPETADTKDSYLLEGQTYRNDELGYNVRVLRAVPATATTPAGLEVQVTLDRDPDTQAVRPLSDAPFLSATNGLGPVERNLTNGGAPANDGEPLRLGNAAFQKGLGVSAPSDVVFDLRPFGNKCTTFRAEIGPDHASRGGDTVAWQVYGQKAGQSDWDKLFDSGIRTGLGLARVVSIPNDIGASVRGYAKVRLTVTDGGNGNARDTVIWGNPRLVCDPGAPNPTPAPAPTPPSTSGARSGS